ncbi:hypothetical protein [Helicobacter pylori]|uniref:hypothetical protein n=1 Tax=Helicobacter pylori TaxID=210 RepID=UPI000286393F|nr:hypothetical protein [Helicobacter pylori]EKE93366.1 hypothetical protein OUQ_1384 [Helicobacter pylori R055a]
MFDSHDKPLSQFIPIIVLMGAFVLQQSFSKPIPIKFKKTLSQKPLKSEIILQDELFCDFY